MKAMSSIEGDIIQLAMALNLEKGDVMRSYQDFFVAFGTTVRFEIMVQFSKPSLCKGQTVQEWMRKEKKIIDQCLKEWNREGIDTVYFSPISDQNFLRWIQDPFLVLVDKQSSPQLLYKPIPSARSTFFTDQFGLELGLDIRLGKVLVEGGQVLIFGNLALIGKNVILDNKENHFESCGKRKYKAKLERKETERRLKKIIGVKRLLWVGSDWPFSIMINMRMVQSYQPFFHLDLYVSLLGTSDSGKTWLSVAEISPKWTSPCELTDRDKEDYCQRWNALEKVVHLLRSQGFEVSRMPMAINYQAPGRAYFSYNNVQVSQGASGKIVYVPQYAKKVVPPTRLESLLKETDQLAVETYKSAGFHDVRRIGGFALRQAVESRGSVRCLTKVLKRKG